MGDLSAHFDSAEFRCRHCGVTKISGRLVSGLELLRGIGYPGGLVIASGYRCPAHNTAVGGAAGSQHLYGAAADVTPRVTLAQVRALKVFSGIGWQAVGGRRLVRHVDVRHVSGHNPTGGTVTAPTIWSYE